METPTSIATSPATTTAHHPRSCSAGGEFTVCLREEHKTNRYYHGMKSARRVVEMLSYVLRAVTILTFALCKSYTPYAKASA